MKSLRIRSSGIAQVLLAMAMPAMGGRMIEGDLPRALPGARDAEPVPMAEPASLVDAEDDEKENAEQSVMDTEPDTDAEPVVDDISTPTPPPRRWKFRQSFRLGFSHDDNIFLSSQRKQGDEILEVGANFSLTWGDYVEQKENFLTIQYSPSYIFYADHSNLNGFQQDGSLAGQWRLAKLTLGTQMRIQTLTGADVDVGNQADRTIYQIGVSGKYDYSDKTSLEASFTQNTSDYQSNLDSTEWVNHDWIDYQLFPKTRVGAGVALGYLKPEGGDVQTYEQALVRVSNPVTGKLSFSASGGIELRQLGGDGGSQTTPVFTLGATYRPFDGTEVSLDASRRNYSSAARVGQNYTATGVSASVRQRLMTRFFLTFAGGYEDAKYEAVESDTTTARHDEYVFARTSLAFACTKRINFELYYQYRKNTSTVEFSAFDSNTTGLQATIGF